MALIDVLRDPLRFRYRLLGVLLVERFGFDMTGKYLEDFPLPSFRSFLARAWIEVVERGVPTHEFHNDIIDGRRREFETLRLPLAGDGQTIDMLLLASVHRH